MINLSLEICQKIREARRAAKLGQIEVAREVGCNQSALSMFEQGQPTKLNDEVVRKLAAKFGIALDDAHDEVAESPVRQASMGLGGRAYCPNPRCPSNTPYEVDGVTRFLPDRDRADPVGGRYCALCGEVLQRCCPNCAEPVHAGGICSHCGEPYIAV